MVSDRPVTTRTDFSSKFTSSTLCASLHNLLSILLNLRHKSNRDNVVLSCMPPLVVYKADLPDKLIPYRSVHHLASRQLRSSQRLNLL